MNNINIIYTNYNLQFNIKSNNQFNIEEFNNIIFNNKYDLIYPIINNINIQNDNDTLYIIVQIANMNHMCIRRL